MEVLRREDPDIVATISNKTICSTVCSIYRESYPRRKTIIYLPESFLRRVSRVSFFLFLSLSLSLSLSPFLPLLRTVRGARAVNGHSDGEKIVRVEISVVFLVKGSLMIVQPMTAII